MDFSSFQRAVGAAGVRVEILGKEIRGWVNLILRVAINGVERESREMKLSISQRSLYKFEIRCRQLVIPSRFATTVLQLAVQQCLMAMSINVIVESDTCG